MIFAYRGADFACRRRKRPESLKSGKKRNGRRITHMMSYFRRKIQRTRTTKIVEKIFWMTLCRLLLVNPATFESISSDGQSGLKLVIVS
jgi:hypothetical protein